MLSNIRAFIRSTMIHNYLNKNIIRKYDNLTTLQRRGIDRLKELRREESTRMR